MKINSNNGFVRALLLTVLAIMAIGVLWWTAFAQKLWASKPSAAVYVVGAPEGRDVIAAAVYTCLEKSGRYSAAEIDANDLTRQEEAGQAKLSNAQIADLGKGAKADYVCVVQLSEFDGATYVSTRMLDVKTKSATGKTAVQEVPSGVKILDFIKNQVDSMLGAAQPQSKAAGGGQAPNTFTDGRGGGANTVTDVRDGKVYKIVKIGGQTWMAENLNYQSGNSWCYENDDYICKKYGRLYNWSMAQSVCPNGWHLPSRGEWNELVNTAGGNTSAGATLKSKSGWNKNGNGTDKFGFSALPGGRSSKAFFGGWLTTTLNTPGVIGWWWTATENSSGYPYCWFINLKGAAGEIYAGKNDDGLSVRCVKD